MIVEKPMRISRSEIETIQKPEPRQKPYKEYYTASFPPEPFEQALQQCRDEGDEESAKAVIRGRRNRLLEASDARMSLDRMGITLPSYTLTGIIEFVRTIMKTLTGDWAQYRQALRDITDQPGFPFDVTWPEEPKE